MVPFAQSDPRMIPASRRLYNAVVEQRLTLPRDCELRQHLSNTIARHTRRGWRLDRPHWRAKIDGVVRYVESFRPAQ